MYSQNVAGELSIGSQSPQLRINIKLLPIKTNTAIDRPYTWRSTLASFNSPNVR